MQTTVGVAALVLMLTCAAAAAAQVSIGGQLRTRYELRDATRTDHVTTMRARVQLSAPIETGVRAFLQLQDTRIWGDEASTTASSGHFDLHQGFLDLQFDSARVAARIGRQEAVYGEERLIGATDWALQGRAFDGLRMRLHTGATTADLFGFQISDASAAGKSVDEYLTGAYGTFAVLPVLQMEAYALHGRSNASRPTRQTTIGTRLSGGSRLAYRVEAALQTGTRAGNDVAANMVTARLTYSPEPAVSLTLWIDHLSGDETPTSGDTRTFDTMFATNHKFYGIADVFTNIPVHTAGRGLNDLALKTSWTISKHLSVAADAHEFRAASSSGLSASRMGREFDLVATTRRSERLSASAGAAYFQAGPAMRQLSPAAADQFFLYVALNAQF